MILKETFMECSSNILETLLCDYCKLPKDQHLSLSHHTLLTQKQLCDYWKLPKDQYLLLSHHTLLTQKQLFHRELFRISFSLKCFRNVSRMSQTLER